MNIFAKLFGSDKVIGKITDGVYNGVDKLVYSEEEKADNFQKLLKLYEPFKIAQRFLALIFGIPYAVAWGLTFLKTFITNDLAAIDPQLSLLSGTMGQIVLAIVAFYFLGGTLNSLSNSSSGKK